MNVLVAGGAGYIGSHTVKRLKESGHKPVIYDNLSRGHKIVTEILKVPVVVADLNDRATLLKTLRDHHIDTVMHFAAYAYVGESVEKPLLYYQNNVATTINVLQCMAEANVNRFVFSSTCAVYGDVEKMPITEDEKKKPVSPYGRTKLMVEEVLTDYANSNKQFGFAALRYFNASGCAMDGTLGEDHEPETHLIPVVLQSILGVRDKVTLFGEDYPTPDGTNIRDYIHVDDLADAHIFAMEKLRDGQQIRHDGHCCRLAPSTVAGEDNITAKLSADHHHVLRAMRPRHRRSQRYQHRRDPCVHQPAVQLCAGDLADRAVQLLRVRKIDRLNRRDGLRRDRIRIKLGMHRDARQNAELGARIKAVNIR